MPLLPFLVRATAEIDGLFSPQTLGGNGQKSLFLFYILFCQLNLNSVLHLLALVFISRPPCIIQTQVYLRSNNETAKNVRLGVKFANKF